MDWSYSIHSFPCTTWTCTLRKQHTGFLFEIWEPLSLRLIFNTCQKTNPCCWTMTKRQLVYTQVFFLKKRNFIHTDILIFTGIGRRRGEKEQRKPRTTRAKRIQRGRKGGVRDGGWEAFFRGRGTWPNPRQTWSDVSLLPASTMGTPVPGWVLE